MRHLGIVTGCLLFFWCQPALADDTQYIYLKTCGERATESDPSILSRKGVDSRSSCGSGYPAKIVLIDTWYGFETAVKTVHGVESKPRVTVPSEGNVFATHKPCRVTYPDEGIYIEWLIPRESACDGRPNGSYYRLYTPEEVCLRPGGGCVAVADLTEVGKKRYHESLRVAYSGY